MVDAARGRKLCEGGKAAQDNQDAMFKTSSFENIEELSADLIARGRREVERASSQPSADWRARSPARPHGARIRSKHAGARADEPELRSKHAGARADVAPTFHSRPRSWLAGYFASSSCAEDDQIAVAALPPAHSQCLFAVSWLCMVTSIMCVYYGVWDFLVVPCGVWINSVNYWRKPDYGWRRYTDIVYVQFAIPFSSYKALEAAEPYRNAFFVCLISGISFFGNACRLCTRPADGSWRQFLLKNPAHARRLKWSTASHVALHVMCNLGNAALIYGLYQTRSGLA